MGIRARNWLIVKFGVFFNNNSYQFLKSTYFLFHFNWSVQELQSICSQCTLFLPPENLKVFWRFQGVEKGCSGNKWINTTYEIPRSNLRKVKNFLFCKFVHCQIAVLLFLMVANASTAISEVLVILRYCTFHKQS